MYFPGKFPVMILCEFNKNSLLKKCITLPKMNFSKTIGDNCITFHLNILFAQSLLLKVFLSFFQYSGFFSYFTQDTLSNA